VSRPAKTLNVRAFLILLIVAACAVVTTTVIHWIQVNRNAGGLVSLARARLEDGRSLEAMTLFARYLNYRPNDATAHAEFTRLLVENAERPTATQQDRGFAYNSLETAVRKNPQDLQLRKKLVEWMLLFGRSKAAGDELIILREQAAAAPNGPADADPLDPNELKLLQSRALAGDRHFDQAASMAASIIGWDMGTRAFSKEDADQAPHSFTVPASLFLAALSQEKRQDPQTATAVLEHLVKVNPQALEAWLALARLHQTHRKLDKAAAAIRTAATIAPENADVLFTDLELALAEKRYDNAEELGQNALRLFPDDARSYRSLAALAMLQGKQDNAIDMLREGLDRLPKQPLLLLMLTEALLQVSRVAEADETITAFVKRYGSTSTSVGLLEARVLILQQRWLPARQKLDGIRPLVAESDELTKQVDLFLGQCHEMLGQFDEQLAANRRVLDEDHESLAARIGVANALAASGKLEAALVEFESIAASIPPDRLPAVPPVWNPLLQLRIASQTNHPEAERDWSLVDQLLEALEQSPLVSDSQLVLLRSDVLVRKGQIETAFELLKKAVEATPAAPQPLAALALLTLRDQGPADARSLLEKAPATIADDPILLMVGAQVAARLPAAEAATALANLEQKAHGLPPAPSTRLLSTIASMYVGMGQRGEAERVWRAAVLLDPDNFAIRTSLFELACDEGDVEKARAAADELSRIFGATSPLSGVSAAAVTVLDVRVGQSKKNAARATDNGEPDASPLPTADTERLTTAKNLLIQAENERPGWAQIQQLFAEIAVLQGDNPTAIERLQRATELGSASPGLVRQLVTLLYVSNRFAEAQQALAKVGPDGLGGSMQRVSAELELKSGQFDEAVARAERNIASQENPTAMDLLWFGQLLSRAGKSGRAAEVLQQAVEAQPTLPSGWLALAANQAAQGQVRTAEQTLQKADTHLASPQREMVAAQGAEILGRLDDAERSFRAAVAAAPIEPATLRSLAAFLIRRGRLLEARQELQAIVALPREDDAGLRIKQWARRTLAELMAESGGYRDIEGAIALLDGNADANGKLPVEDIALQVTILAGRSDPTSWRRAIALFGQLAARQPLSTDQRIQKARLLEQLGRWNESRDELLSIVSAPNTPPPMQSLLIGKLLDHKELQAARLWLKALASRTPDAPVVSALEARLALAEGDRHAAVAAARKLMVGNEPIPELARQPGVLAALLEELGFSTAADTMFTKFAAISADGLIAQADFLGRQHRGDEALDLLETSWDKLPLQKLLQTSLSALRSLGTTVTPQQFDRVDRWFAKARRLDPAPNTPMLYAELLSLKHLEPEVVANYREILERNDLTPQQAAVVSNNLAFYLAQPETAVEAETLIDRAIIEMGPLPDLLDTRGMVRLATGKGKEAVADFQDALLVPTATKYFHLACALASQQQTDASRNALAEANKRGLNVGQLTSGDRERLDKLNLALGL